MVEKINRKDHVKNGVLHRVKEERNILHTHNKEKDWPDCSHLAQGRPSKRRYSRNDLKKVTGIRGKRRKQLRDVLLETSRYCAVKDEALDRTLWRRRFGSNYGLVEDRLRDE
jgi:hypothetical protein